MCLASANHEKNQENVKCEDVSKRYNTNVDKAVVTYLQYDNRTALPVVWYVGLLYNVRASILQKPKCTMT